jgi:hypothetical protein
MWRLVAAVVIVCFGACSSTATIVRTDGPDSEAEIVSSDARAIYVRGHNGQTYRIGRESISDIDHPGNVEMIIGGALLGFLAFGVAISSDNATRREDLPALVFAYGVPGLTMLMSGLFHYIPSVRATSAFQSADTTVQPAAPPTWVPGPGWTPQPAYPPPGYPPPAYPPPATAPPAAPPPAPSAPAPAPPASAPPPAAPAPGAT